MPADFHVEGIDHLFVPTGDFEAALSFWRDGLRLEVGEDWGDGDHRGAWLRLGASRVTVADAAPEAGVELVPGRCYAYLRVRGLDAMLEWLSKRGVAVLSGPRPVTLHWGPRMVAVRDPDGNPVMLVEWPAGPAG